MMETKVLEVQDELHKLLSKESDLFCKYFNYKNLLEMLLCMLSLVNFPVRREMIVCGNLNVKKGGLGIMKGRARILLCFFIYSQKDCQSSPDYNSLCG